MDITHTKKKKEILIISKSGHSIGTMISLVLVAEAHK